MVNLDYLYDPAAAKPIFDKNYFVDKKLGFQVIENGTILPHKNLDNQFWGAGGLTYNDGKYIQNSFVHGGWGKDYNPPPNQFKKAPKPSFISECFIMFGVTSLPTTFVACGF